MLNANGLNWDQIGEVQLLSEGHQLGKAELLFEKIEDAQIQAQLDKLEATKIANVNENVEHEPQKDMVSFDDFMKMDMRIGKILTAEKVAKTKKLLKFTVDTGLDQRTIVSGIAEHYTPETMIGKSVMVLMNLPPREIKGIESHGMMLFAEEPSGKLVAMTSENEVNPGATIG